MAYQAPRGTHDILPGPADPQQDPDLRLFHAYKWQALEATFRDVCRRFGVDEIRTPIFEHTELFKRSVGEETDIVGKEMYEFEDRSGESLTLRPEGTAGVVRAVVQNNLAGGQSPFLKLAYINSHFRYERPQRGRYRQHHQVGVEYLGGDAAEVDVEVIALGMTYLAAIGLDDVELQLNSVGTTDSRGRYREALRDHLRPHLDKLSDDSRRRFETNPLRVLDSKDERDQPYLGDAPAMIDHLEPAAREHFERVLAGLDNLGIAYTLNPRLVRGLDYYEKTAFEVVHGSLGSQNVVLGGGRYDGLVEQIGGPAVPGIGFGSGIERALLILEQLGRDIGERSHPDAWLVARSDSERTAAQRLAQGLRGQGLCIEHDLQGRSMKAQSRAAGGSGARFALYVRDDLLETGRVAVKRLEDGVQFDHRLDEVGPILRGERPFETDAPTLS